MLLNQPLSPEQVKCNWLIKSKKQLLMRAAVELTHVLPDLDADTIFECLVKREKLGSTGIGQGVAIPHCRSEHSRRMIGLFIKLFDPIEFDAPDNQPVDLFYFLIAPQKNSEAHFKLLDNITDCLQDPRNRFKLKHCQTDSELFTTLSTLSSIPDVKRQATV